MSTLFSLRDLGISPGQARQDEFELELVPYVQGTVDFLDDAGGGKAPKSKLPTPPGGIEYVVTSGTTNATIYTTAMTDGTSFRLRFEADYAGPCARCLEPATFHVSVDSYAVHDPEEEDDDLRSEHVDDRTHELDVTAWAQEEVGLRFPTRVLCRRDCLGLCPQCGIDMNEDPEHAHDKPMDTRWEALKALQVEGAEPAVDET